jgi:hypothetical protein
MVRYALPVEGLPEAYRRQCQEALQRTAKGCARVRSVYYPVPAHAVARLEIDERLGVLYVHLRGSRADSEDACIWVVSGVRLEDNRPVHAVMKVP